MKTMLITGGTVFVSRFAAEYFKDRYAVSVLNRNSRTQCDGVSLIEGDRHALGDLLRAKYFDVILDITAYTGRDVENLLDAVGGFGDYVLISSSAVYPETAAQPFREDCPTGENGFWGKYGTDKIRAELVLLERVPNAYILRPPYLYGPGNNVYREAFAFECALQDRKFYLPKDGSMKLQFFHVEDLCRFVDILLGHRPGQHIFNVGNPDTVTTQEWVRLCYQTLGKKPEFVYVGAECPQRSYFPFHDYGYALDVSAQRSLMPVTKPLYSGLAESLAWYRENKEKVNEKPLLSFIAEHFEEDK